MIRFIITLWLCFCATYPSHGESFQYNFQEIKERVEQGDVHAYYQLANLYFFGQGGVKKDEAMGIKWYLLAAENGDCVAQYVLGSLYENGQSVEQDFEKSVKWYRKSAEQDWYFAQHALGDAYSKGEGVVQDWSMAMMWYKKAAQHGYVRSEAMLGLAYYTGKKQVKQDFAKAAKWFHIVAKKEESEDIPVAHVAFIQCELGKMYYKGQGVPKNYKEALKWFQKSIKNGETSAMGLLGMMYYSGHGVIQSYIEAHKWLNLASAHGDKEASKIRDGLSKQMTGEQIAKAQDRALEWIEKREGQQ